MKRIVALVLLFMFLFCACDSAVIETKDDTVALIKDSEMLDLQDESDNGIGSFFVGSWLSYIEALPNKKMTKEEYGEYIGKIMSNLKKAHVNNLFVHVRPFCDAIYPSDIFPSSSYAVEKPDDELAFDYFYVIIEKAKEYEIAVHAWINPYRVQGTLEAEKLSNKSFAKTWYVTGSENVKEAAGGLYLNPASEEVRRKITDGVRELFEKYDIAGIHIDDYFYPTTDEDFDKTFYESYKAKNGQLSLTRWRRENVTALVSALYSTVKSYGSDKLFTVSPNGNIEKDEDTLYADVKLWGSRSGYCDMLIPQIYFGFENETSPFEKTALSWKNITSDCVDLCAGLALYKAGAEDEFAGSGKDEWCINSDVIKREIEFAKSNGYCGICLYSASYIAFDSSSCAKETQNFCSLFEDA